MARFSKKVQRAIDDVVAAARRAAQEAGSLSPAELQFATAQVIDMVGSALLNPEGASIRSPEARLACTCVKNPNGDYKFKIRDAELMAVLRDVAHRAQYETDSGTVKSTKQTLTVSPEVLGAMASVWENQVSEGEDIYAEELFDDYWDEDTTDGKRDDYTNAVAAAGIEIAKAHG